jgi:hypothetical protein
VIRDSAYANKVVVHSRSSDSVALAHWVEQWLRDGVSYVGVVGVNASALEDVVDWTCIELSLRDGREPGGDDGYDILTAFHQADECLDDAIELARSIGDHPDAPICIVEI